MIKLIASDLDGTLLQNGAQSLNPRTIELIRELKRMGIVFVAASGRQYPNLQRLFEPIKDEIAYICENGALVMAQDEIVSKSIIKREVGEEILETIRKRKGCEVLLSGMHTSYIQPKVSGYEHQMRYLVKNNVETVEDIMTVQEPYLKISVYEEGGVENSESYFVKTFADRVTVVTSGSLWLDMIPKGVNKGTALQKLQEKFQISSDEIMVFGDHYNDIEMLQMAKYSYAMENAQPGVKEICNYCTDEVEKTLEKLIKGELDHD